MSGDDGAVNVSKFCCVFSAVVRVADSVIEHQCLLLRNCPFPIPVIS